MIAFQRLSTVLALTGLSLAGPACVSTDQAIQDAQLNQSEAKQFRKAQTKTRMGGTAAGAGLGALAGGLIGGNWKSAAIGAAAGMLAGSVAGEKKAQQQGRILVTESELDRHIASTAAANRQLRNQITQMAADRKAYLQRISKAKSGNDKKALAAIKKEIKSGLGKADSSINSAQKTIKSNGSISSQSSRLSRLHTETTNLSSSVQKLQKERKLMASLYNSIDV